MTRPKLPLIVLSILALFAFAACAAAPAAAPDATASYAAADSAAYAGDIAAEEFAPADAMDRMMVGTANLDLVVTDTAATVETITARVNGSGGYVADSSFYQTTVGDQTVLNGSMTVRVPAVALEETLDELAALAVEVTGRNLSREDVTDQYVDLDARLRNLQAAETELLALLTEVRTKPDAAAEDILAVHRSLMEIRGEIEQLQGRKNMLDNLVTMSTIYVALRADTSALPIVRTGWQPGATVTQALSALVTSLQWLGRAAIWVTLYIAPVLLTVLLPLALIVWALIWVVRRRRSMLHTA